MATEQEENKHKQNLTRARMSGMANRAMSLYNKASNPLGTLTDAAQGRALDYADSRLGHNSFKEGPYIVAAGGAILKDLLDLGFIGSLPGVGTVITICISILIGFMLILAGGYRKKDAATQMIKKFLVLIVGTLTEFLFGLNFVPMETITVGVIYWMAKKEFKQAQKEAEEAKKAQNNLVAFPGKQKPAESASDQSMGRAA